MSCEDAFGFDLEQYLFFGGYPGAASLTSDVWRWGRYVMDALIEPTIARDILQMSQIRKPALLKRLFQFGSRFSGQILAYHKMLGQLQDAGNTTTLAHYLELLDAAGLLAGVPKFSGREVRIRASSPKLNVLNTALFSAPAQVTQEQARSDPSFWGRLVESAVGAHLLNGARAAGAKVYYWRERNREVDFVLSLGPRLCAIEVKSGRARGTPPGLEAFAKRYRACRKLLVGGGGLPLASFFTTAVEDLL